MRKFLQRLFQPRPIHRHSLLCLNQNVFPHCPDCGSAEFHGGPMGGAARNIMCAGCGAKYWWCPPFAPARIFNDDCFYNMRVRERLENL